MSTQYTPAQIQQQNQVFQQALASGRITQAQYNAAMTVQNQNLVFGQALQSGKITQAQYNQAMTYQATKPQTAQQLGVSEAVFQQAKQSVPTGSYINAITPSGVSYYTSQQLQQERESSRESISINDQFAKIQGQNVVFGQALQSGKITQAQYNQAIGFQNQLEIAEINRAQKEGFIDTATAQASITQINTEYNTFLASLPTQQQGAPTPNMPLRPTPSLAYATNPGLIKSPTQSGGIPQSSFFVWSNLTPAGQAQVRQSVVKDVLSMAAPVAFVFNPPAALAGAVISPIITQGIKAVQGQGLLTTQEAIESAAGGAVFSAGASGVIGAVGLTGAKGVVAAVGRIGVNAGLGAGGGTIYEYASKGKVTGQGALQGAAFGAAFGLAGEVFGAVNAKYDVTGKVTNRVMGPLQERFATSKMSENLSQYYEVINEGNTRYQPSFAERSAMEITGLRPVRPAVGFEALPNIATSGLWGNEAVTVNGVSRNVPVDVDLANMGATREGGLLGFNKGEGTEFVAKSTMLNTELRMQAGLEWDVNQTAYGRSFDPVEYSKVVAKVPEVAVAKSFPLYLGLGGELIELKEIPLKGMMGKQDEGIPESMFEKEYQGKAGKTERLAFNKTPYKFGENTEYSYARENLPTLQDVTPKEYTPPSGSMKPIWDSIGSKAPADVDFPASPISQVALQQGKVSTISGALPNVAPTPQMSRMAKTNPFLRFAPIPYYAQSQQQYEEETTYFSVPNSGLAHPQQPKFITDATQKSRQATQPISAVAQPNLFATQLTRGNLLTKPLESLTQIPTTDITQRQQPSQIPNLLSIPTQATTLIPFTTPIRIQKTTPTTPPPLINRNQPLSFPFLPLGSKAMEFGGNKQDFPNFTGLLSIKRAYPIKTPEEFLGLPRKKNK